MKIVMQEPLSSEKMRRSPRRWAVAIALVWAALTLGPAGVAIAQGSAASAPSAVATTEILQRAGDDQRLVERVARRTAAVDPSVQLSKQLDEIVLPVDQKMTALSAEQLRSLPVMRLESLERHWRFDARSLDRWQLQLRQAFAPDALDAAALAQRRLAWTATKAAIAAGDSPAVLADRVDTILHDLANAEQQVSNRIAAQVDLGRRGNTTLSQIQAGQAEVAAAIADIDQRLLRLDSPPLWAATPREDGTELAAVEQGLQVEAKFATAYTASSQGTIRAMHALQLLLLPLMLWLAWRGRNAALDTATGEADRRILRRPLSAWILLSAMIVLVFERDAPMLVQEVALLAALVPLMRLLPAQGLHWLGTWPYVALVLFFLDRASLVLMSSGFLYRWYEFVVTVAALAVMVWLVRRTRTTPAIDPRTASRVVAAGGLSVLLLCISLIANAVGNTSLADTLTSGVIDSGYFFLLLYANAKVLLALLRSTLHQPRLIRMRRVGDHAPAVIAFAERALALGSLLGWLYYTMDRVRLLRPFTAAAQSVLSFRLEVGEISISLGHILVFVVSVVIAFWSARVTRGLLRDELQGAVSLPRGVGNSVASLSYYGVLMLGFLVALSAAGFKVSQLAFIFGALGVGIGFGLQNIVNNFVSGLVLMFERPIQPGDVVDVAGTSGRVRSIGMRATIIRTFDGADVIVPNGTLLTGNLSNWTLDDRHRRIEVEVGVAYGSDPQQVLALLEAVARETPGVAAQPAPAALLKDFGDSSINFVLRAWTVFDGWGATRTELMTRVLAGMKTAGIQIPFNQLDLNVRSVPAPAAPAASDTTNPSAPA